MFINKIDRAGSRVEEILEELQALCGDRFLPLWMPVRQGEKDPGIARPKNDLSLLCEALGRFDDTVLEAYLEDRPIAEPILTAALRKAVCNWDLIPVLCGSAIQGLGIRELLDAIPAYLPTADSNACDELSGIIYKIEHDKTMGRLAHIRLFGGSLRAREQLTLHAGAAAPSGTHADSRIGKISQIRRAMGGKYTDIGRVDAGNVAVLCGLGEARVGDTVGRLLHDRKVDLTQPFLQVTVAPSDAGRLTALVEALRELSAEEPYLQSRWEKSDREIVIRITGEIQLEVLRVLLRERYGLEVCFSPPRVVYRETPVRVADGFEAYTMPKPCWAVVQLRLEPEKRGSGVQFDRGNVPNNQLFYRYQNQIEQCFWSCVEQGIYGWEVTDFRCTLVGGEHHTMHTHPLDFFVATPVAFLRGLQNAGSRLLEPYLRVRISAPDDCMGRIISDVTLMRGSFDTPVLQKGKMILEATLPVADSLDYPIRLASETKGKGTIFASFDGYYPCPDGFESRCPRRGPDPLDRAKWILYNRGAMTEGER